MCRAARHHACDPTSFHARLHARCPVQVPNSVAWSAPQRACSEASFTSGCDFWPEGHELVSTTTQRRLPSALAVTNTSAPAHLKWCSTGGRVRVGSE